MPSWFSKVFKTESEVADERPSVMAADVAYDEDKDVDGEYDPAPRRVVNAPILAGEGASGEGEGEIRIKARMEPRANACVFMVDRPLLKGYSFWAPEPEVAYAHSPLASSIFDLGGVATVLIHEMTMTVSRDGSDFSPWETFAKKVGDQLRAHLQSGLPVLDPFYQDAIPTEDEIRAQLQRVIDEEINPGIASHSGVITLNRVTGNTVYITMGGGCQGCAASSITLRSGVEGAFRKAVPALGAVLDETDHMSGANPYFSELPAGMGM